MKEDRMLFLIPRPEFFGQIGGIGGHVSHVFGVLGALGQKGFGLEVMAGDGEDLLARAGYVSRTVSNTGGRIAFALRFIAGVRWARRETRFDFAYMRYVGGFAPFIPVLKRALGGVPLVLEVNSLTTQHYALFRLIDARALAAADVVVVVSETLKAQIADLFGSDVAGRVLVLPNGVDVDRFKVAPAPFEGQQAGKKYIGYVGVLKPGYGLEDLITAYRRFAREHTQWKLVFIGGGPHLSQLQALAAREAGIQFTNVVPFDAVPGILRGLDIAVYPTTSANFYMSPIKLYEYMAAARPIIAARTLQTAELLGEDRCGTLYDAGDPASLARALERIANNPVEAARMAEAAFENVATGHTWAARIGTLLEALSRKRADAC